MEKPGMKLADVEPLRGAAKLGGNDEIDDTEAVFDEEGERDEKGQGRHPDALVAKLQASIEAVRSNRGVKSGLDEHGVPTADLEPPLYPWIEEPRCMIGDEVREQSTEHAGSMIAIVSKLEEFRRRLGGHKDRDLNSDLAKELDAGLMEIISFIQREIEKTRSV